MNAGAKATVTYNPKEQLSQSRASLTSLGKLKISIIGGAETGSFTISLAGYDADTSKFVLPVPYGFAFEFNSASSEKVDEYKISSGIALLPGSELKVGNNTKLTINSSGSLSVFDSLSELTFSLKSNNSPKYPTTGYAANPAKLVLEGTLNVEGGFGGSIEGYDGAKLILGKNAKGAYTGTYKCVDSDTHKQLICGKEIQIYPFKDNYHLSHTSSCYEYACKKIPTDYQECYSTALKVEFGFVKEGLVGSISGLAWNNEENGVTYNTYCKIKTSANGNNIIAHSNTTYTYNSQGYWE